MRPELVSSLGLGRTPIREALNRIAAEGLIEFEVNKGPIVRPLDIAEVDQLFESYRVAGQIAAAYCRFEDPGLMPDVLKMQEQHRAAIKARRPLDVSYWNYAFHTRIAVSSGNDHLSGFCRRVNNHARRINTLIYRLESAQPTYPNTQLDIARENALHSYRNNQEKKSLRACKRHGRSEQDLPYPLCPLP
jgi:DNA-binding GntR family transcriptional regulator